MTRMTFGKFKGRPVNEIPPDYLSWALKTIADMQPELRRAMERALGQNAPTKSSAVALRPVVEIQDALKTWYRYASMRHHPDHGGSNERQRVVNEAYAEISVAINAVIDRLQEVP